MKRIDLTEGNVFKVIIGLTTPLVGSSLLQFAYNFIGMIWVGGLGSSAVASIGSASFYIGLGYAINAMIIVGAGVKVSHAIGRGDTEGTNGYVNTSFVMTFIMGIIFAVIVILFGKTFIGFLDINNVEVERMSLNYLLISGIAMIIVFFNNLYVRLFSSFGNNKISLVISSTGLIINIILDPIFIYVLGLGVNGAAIATVITNVVVLLLSIKASKGLYEVNFKRYFDKNMAKEISNMGIPNAAQRVIFTIINIFIAKMIATFGADAIAAQKIGLQIESITLIVIGAFNGSAASFIGQNYGAKKVERINKGYNMSLLVGIGYTLIMTVFLLLFPENLASIFVKEPETIKITADYLRIIGLTQVFATIEIITSGTFMGLGATKWAASISIGLTVIRLPMAAIFIKYYGINGIWASIALSSMLKGVVSFTAYKFVLWKRVKRLLA